MNGLTAAIVFANGAETRSKAYTDAAIAALPNGLIYKGEVNYYNLLPTDAEIGDTYTVKYYGTSGTTEDGSEYVWGTYEGTDQWIKLGANTASLKPMKSGWKTGTTAAAASAILGDSDVKEGDAFLGGVEWSDLPGGMFNAECKAYVVLKSEGSSIVQFELTSADTAPYAWFYNSAGATWRSYVPLKNTIDSLANNNEAATTQAVKTYADSKYTKPVNGIPKADLASGVQASLDKADSALQSVTKADVGLGNVDNKSEATIKTDFTGSIASGNTGFATGGDVYTQLQNEMSAAELEAIWNGVT